MVWRDSGDDWPRLSTAPGEGDTHQSTIFFMPPEHQMHGISNTYPICGHQIVTCNRTKRPALGHQIVYDIRHEMQGTSHQGMAYPKRCHQITMRTTCKHTIWDKLITQITKWNNMLITSQQKQNMGKGGVKEDTRAHHQCRFTM